MRATTFLGERGLRRRPAAVDLTPRMGRRVAQAGDGVRAPRASALAVAPGRRAAVLAAALVFLTSCGGGHGSSTTGPSTGRVTNLGYGLPHYWNTTDPSSFAQLLVDHGLGMTVIEYRPLSLDRTEVPLEVASRFLAAMRARQITTLVPIMNWNCRNRGVCPASMDDLVASVNRLASLGTSQLIVEVAEPNDPQGPESVLRVRRAWPGTFAVNWGFPVPSGITWDVRDQHECNPDPDRWSLAGDLIHTTDCRLALTTNAGAIAGWAKRTGRAAIIYDFFGTTPNVSVLDEMRDAIR